MVLRNIVKIDEDKCTGCGLCVNACAEGAIEIVDGKAKLISEIYCDGLGACIGDCPEDAITIEQREAAEFDEAATEAHLAAQQKAASPGAFVCPGMTARQWDNPPAGPDGGRTVGSVASQLSHWPVQLALISPAAPALAGADLLLVADCVPFAMGDFHPRFLKDHAVVVGCPKLDDCEPYVRKLAAVIKGANLGSLTVVHMEVPCCSGLTQIARLAVAQSGVDMSFDDVTVGLQGEVLRTQTMT